MLDDEKIISVYATLIFRGDNLLPDKITAFLGIQPDQQYKKGELFGGKKLKVRKTGLWFYSTNGHISSIDVVQHLVSILDQIEPVKSRFVELIKAEKIYSEITCVLNLFTIENGFDIPPYVLSRIVTLNIPLGISIYCLGDGFNNSIRSEPDKSTLIS
jgi:hypothetical protein